MDPIPENTTSQTPPPDPPTGTPPTPPNPDGPSHHHRGTGKVARLPKKIRDEVNLMILDGVPFAEIIRAIGPHGEGITEANIGNWKAGSYRQWLNDHERNEALRSTHEAALDLLDQKAGANVQDAGRAVAGAQLYELLISFNPTDFAAALADKPELYLRIINSLSRLSEGEATCSHRRALQSLIETKLQPAQPTDGKLVLSEAALKDIARQIKLL